MCVYAFFHGEHCVHIFLFTEIIKGWSESSQCKYSVLGSVELRIGGGCQAKILGTLSIRYFLIVVGFCRWFMVFMKRTAKILSIDLELQD